MKSGWWIIAIRDFKAALATPVFFAIIACFLVIAGFFFFSILGQYNALLQKTALVAEVPPSLNNQVIAPFFQLLQAVLIFLTPLLTMRTLTEEKRGGTFELLMTSPITVSDIVWGKFLSIGLLITTTIALAMVFPLVLVLFCDPEVPPVFVGFVGLVVSAWAYCAIGVAVSAFSRSQLVAGTITLAILLLLHVLDAPAEEFGGTISRLLVYLSPATHAHNFHKGVIEGVDLVYFLSFAALGVFCAQRALEWERWR